MISYAKGNLIANVTSGVILHQVNCLGIMEAGFALQLKKAYPENFESYRKFCERSERSKLLGNSIITSFNNSNTLMIINAFGQNEIGGRRPTSYDALDTIFHDLYHSSHLEWFDHIHMPMIGCGLGGGNWGVVESIIRANLPDDKDITVWAI